MNVKMHFDHKKDVNHLKNIRQNALFSR